MMGIKDENTKLSTILMMTTYLWSGQATHQVTIECKLLGMNFYLMLLILAAGVNICSCKLPQTTSSPASTLINTEVQCRSGWKRRDNFCFKVFDGITERRTYHGAKQFCERRNGELLSKDDVDTYHYTEKTFWVYTNINASCQCYKSSANSFEVIDCKKRRTVVCKDLIKIDFFGISGGSLISRGETLTLQCNITGYSNEYVFIVIAHKTANGSFGFLTWGHPPMAEFQDKNLRCEDHREFVCEVSSIRNTEIRKDFTVALRDCPPQCPHEVNVTEQTNSSITVSWLPGHDGGAPQHFIVFYSHNSSADDRKWRRRTVLLPSNSRNASSTIDNLPADTVFLFRVVGLHMFEDTVNSSACEEHTVTSRTLDNKKDADSLEIFGLKVSMLHIIIGASVLAVILLLIVVAIIFICRKQAAKKRKNRDVPEDVTRHPTGDEYANAQVIRDAWSGSERESWEQGDDSDMILREVQLSSNNAVYESLCADETEESHTYAN